MARRGKSHQDWNITDADRMNDSFEGGYSRGNEELPEQVNKALGPFEISADETQRSRESTL